MKGYYFATEERCFQYGDGRKIIVGKSHSVKDTPELCAHGLHASPTILQALQYAPGPVLYAVEVTRHIDTQADKFCGQRRKYLRGGYNISSVLRKFARDCALSVAHLWEMPNVVREFLTTGDETLRYAARSAAESDAWSAARSAAESAAWSAAESAAWSAAQSAAWYAAWYAAESAARYAAWSAARSSQSILLENLVLEFWEMKEMEN